MKKNDFLRNSFLIFEDTALPSLPPRRPTDDFAAPPPSLVTFARTKAVSEELYIV
jgi:hypothetical protein